jgi:uncharacterized protein (DUF849 family)
MRCDRKTESCQNNRELEKIGKSIMEFVERAKRLVLESGREVATSDEARKILNLKTL